MRAAAFLDRDGVINFDRSYVYRRPDFEFIPGVFDGARTLKKLGYALVVVTNQSGIGRGIFSSGDFLALDEWMRARFRDEGAEIMATYHCPHHPTDALGAYRIDCDCRKPQPGMLLRAATDHKLELHRSLMIGDNARDLQAARAAGVPTRLLVGSDGLSVPAELPEAGLATVRYRSLADAAAALARRESANADGLPS